MKETISERRKQFELERSNMLRAKLKLVKVLEDEDVLRYEAITSKKKGVQGGEEFAKRFKQKVEEASIVVEYLKDFEILLRILGQSEDYIRNLLAHENAHANKAEELGGVFKGYRLVFFREDGKIRFQPFADAVPLDTWDNSKKKEVMKEVLSAPLAYGDKLSEVDIHNINRLDELYK
jgi:hypothetical protein